MRNLFFMLILLVSTTLVPQETCTTPKEESFEDLNSITKCSIKTSNKSKDKKSRQISVKVSASKNRFLKKRVLEKKSTASSLNDLNASGVSNTNHSLDVSDAISLKKENRANTITNLSNSLSAEEVKKASKFNLVDKIPLFDACKGVKKKNELDCFNIEMIKHIQEHFRYPNEAVISKTQGNVWVRFIIDTNGHVTNIKALGPKGGKILDQEAIRVVSKLTKFIPGVTNGKKTSVKYGFPISFSLED